MRALIILLLVAVIPGAGLVWLCWRMARKIKTEIFDEE